VSPPLPGAAWTSRRRLLQAGAALALAAGAASADNDPSRSPDPRTMSTSRFAYTVYIRALPDQVWSAFRDPAVERRIWMGHALETSWAAGAPWAMVDAVGVVANLGEILAIDAPRRLVLSWRASDLHPERAAEGETRVELRFEAAPGSTKVSVTHTADRVNSVFIGVASESWPLILSNLKSLIETGEVAVA
jgi:uncharacterized protein YndB with AHSA1/START domain